MARRTDGPVRAEFPGAHSRLDQGQATPLTPSPSSTVRRFKYGALRWLGALTVVLLAACGGSDATSPGILPDNAPPQQQAGETPGAAAPSTAQVPAAPPSSPAPARSQAPVPREPDGQRIIADVKYLAEDIGPRPAASASEKRAAEWIADRFRGLGFDVTLQEFAASSEASRTSTLATQGRVIASAPFENSGAARTFTAPLVTAGLGRPEQFPANANGAVVLLERGELLFDQKVRNAQAAGARGAIIYNNETGLFSGALSFHANIPATAISRTEGQKLLADLQRGPVEIEFSVSELGKSVSRNVVAVPPGKECTTVSGGHYDSVQIAPGANDNASGTATVLEIAAVLASKGEIGSNCFVLFGAEEPGLIGSRAYVASLDTAGKQRLKAMLNFDMTGFGDAGWILIGSSDLQRRGLEQATALGIQQVRSGGLPRNSSSDHASFIQAGIPALFYYHSEDRLLHTPQDTADRLNPRYLEEAARMGVAMLEALAAA
jgi:aminopeptidase YwaD